MLSLVRPILQPTSESCKIASISALPVQSVGGASHGMMQLAGSSTPSSFFEQHSAVASTPPRSAAQCPLELPSHPDCEQQWPPMGGGHVAPLQWSQPAGGHVGVVFAVLLASEMDALTGTNEGGVLRMGAARQAAANERTSVARATIRSRTGCSGARLAKLPYMDFAVC